MLRRRERTNGTNGYGTVPTGSHALASRSARAEAGTATGVALVGAIGACVLTGCLCVLTPARHDAAVGEWPIAQNATCLRAARHADYASVSLNFGTPSRQFDLLLRLDAVLPAHDAPRATRVFDDSILQSS